MLCLSLSAINQRWNRNEKFCVSWPASAAVALAAAVNYLRRVILGTEKFGRICGCGLSVAVALLTPSCCVAIRVAGRGPSARSVQKRSFPPLYLAGEVSRSFLLLFLKVNVVFETDKSGASNQLELFAHGELLLKVRYKREVADKDIYFGMLDHFRRATLNPHKQMERSWHGAPNARQLLIDKLCRAMGYSFTISKIAFSLWAMGVFNLDIYSRRNWLNLISPTFSKRFVALQNDVPSSDISRLHTQQSVHMIVPFYLLLQLSVSLHLPGYCYFYSTASSVLFRRQFRLGPAVAVIELPLWFEVPLHISYRGQASGLSSINIKTTRSAMCLPL